MKYAIIRNYQTRAAGFYTFDTLDSAMADLSRKYNETIIQFDDDGRPSGELWFPAENAGPNGEPF